MIGNAKKKWKAAKWIKYIQWARLGLHKMKMQTTISAVYCHERSHSHHAATQKAGRLWKDDDFEMLKQKFDSYCRESIVKHIRKPSCIFRTWQEGWEKVQFNC